MQDKLFAPWKQDETMDGVLYTFNHSITVTGAVPTCLYRRKLVCFEDKTLYKSIRLSAKEGSLIRNCRKLSVCLCHGDVNSTPKAFGLRFPGMDNQLSQWIRKNNHMRNMDFSKRIACTIQLLYKKTLDGLRKY